MPEGLVVGRHHRHHCERSTDQVKAPSPTSETLPFGFATAFVNEGRLEWHTRPQKELRRLTVQRTVFGRVAPPTLPLQICHAILSCIDRSCQRNKSCCGLQLVRCLPSTSSTYVPSGMCHTWDFISKQNAPVKSSQHGPEVTLQASACTIRIRSLVKVFLGQGDFSFSGSYDGSWPRLKTLSPPLCFTISAESSFHQGVSPGSGEYIQTVWLFSIVSRGLLSGSVASRLLVPHEAFF